MQQVDPRFNSLCHNPLLKAVMDPSLELPSVVPRFMTTGGKVLMSPEEEKVLIENEKSLRNRIRKLDQSERQELLEDLRKVLSFEREENASLDLREKGLCVLLLSDDGEIAPEDSVFWSFGKAVMGSVTSKEILDAIRLIRNVLPNHGIREKLYPCDIMCQDLQQVLDRPLSELVSAQRNLEKNKLLDLKEVLSNQSPSVIDFADIKSIINDNDLTKKFEATLIQMGKIEEGAWGDVVDLLEPYSGLLSIGESSVLRYLIDKTDPYSTHETLEIIRFVCLIGLLNVDELLMNIEKEQKFEDQLILDSKKNNELIKKRLKIQGVNLSIKERNLKIQEKIKERDNLSIGILDKIKDYENTVQKNSKEIARLGWACERLKELIGRPVDRLPGLMREFVRAYKTYKATPADQRKKEEFYWEEFYAPLGVISDFLNLASKEQDVAKFLDAMKCFLPYESSGVHELTWGNDNEKQMQHRMMSAFDSKRTGRTVTELAQDCLGCLIIKFYLSKNNVEISNKGLIAGIARFQEERKTLLATPVSVEPAVQPQRKTLLATAVSVEPAVQPVAAAAPVLPQRRATQEFRGQIVVKCQNIPTDQGLYIRGDAGTSVGWNWNQGAKLTRVDTETFVYNVPKGTLETFKYKIRLNDQYWESGSDNVFSNTNNKHILTNPTFEENVTP